jgi:hypothetical protein
MQFTEVGRPDVYIASSKAKHFIPADTSFAIIIYALINSTPPDTITDAPNFRLKVTLGSRNMLEKNEILTVFPSTKEGYDLTSYVLPEGASDTIKITKPLNQCNHYPARMIQGDLYFEFEKRKSQDVLAAYLTIN